LDEIQEIQSTDSNFESQMPITNFTYNCERDQNYFYNYHSNIGEILKHYYSSEFIHAINTKIVNIIDLNQAKTLVNIIQVLNTQIESEIQQEMNDHKEKIEQQIKLANQTSELTGSKHVVLVDKNGDIVGVKSLESIQKDKTQTDQTPLKIEIPTHSIKSNKFKRKKNLKKIKEKSKRKNRKK